MFAKNITQNGKGEEERAVATAQRKATRIFRELGFARILLTVILLIFAILTARYSWNVILIGDGERALYDLRQTYLAPKVDQDPRIAKIIYDDDILIETQKRSPLDRGILARALTHIDTMGARAIGIDILIDQPQNEDVQLMSVLRSMKTPTYLAYATNETNRNNIKQRQQEFLDAFMGNLENSNTQPASIRLEVDIDNVVRSWPEIQDGLPPILSRAMVPENRSLNGYTRSIAYRSAKFEDRPLFLSLPINLIANPDLAPVFTDQIKGKYILIGGDIIDVDQFETPLRLQTQKPMIGLDIHAQMLAQLLDQNNPPAIPIWAIWIIAILVITTGSLSALLSGGVKIALACIAQMIFFISFPLFLHQQGYDTQQLPAFGWILGWSIAFAAVGMAVREISSEQRRFAQSALGKYLPRDIAQEILNEPERLTLHGEKREIFVIFTDLEGFTKMSHQIEPEMVATLLNTYLDKICSIILKHGGTIDKFVGDATVSFWGAPIARADDGERAARAAYEIWQTGEEFRKRKSNSGPTLGKTRVGLHFGEAVIGNFGGEGRMQYTALGDSMNTASRLESANKQTKTGILASREAVERSNLQWWRPLGRVRLRGRAQPVDIFEPRPDLDQEQIDEVTNIIDEFNHNIGNALHRLNILVKNNIDDITLENLLYRMSNLEPGGFYALD